jgi:transcriptional regulator with XRE-family HTH domain
VSLDPEEPEPILAQPEPQPEPAQNHDHALQVAMAIRHLRHKNGMSQRQLAMRMRVPRTYVSKIENEKATPTLSSLERLAKALEVRVPDLLNGGQGADNVRELLSDSFITELMPYLSRLNAMQWSMVVGQMRELTVHTRRTA